MNRILINLALASALAAVVAGCGGSEHDSSMATTAASTPVSSGADAYTQSVQAVLGLTSETTVPIATEGLPTTANDAGMPVAVY